MKKTITESQLRKIVKESIKKILKENIEGGEYINREKLHERIMSLLNEVCDTYDFGENGASILKDDYVEEYAEYLTNSIADSMRNYVSSGNYSISGNFNNIKRDFETEHNGASFDKVIEMIRNGVSNEITEEFKDWSENWFWQTFGTYNIKYNFAEAANEFLEGMEN